MLEIKATELCICSFTLHETDCFSMQAALVYSNQLQVLSIKKQEYHLVKCGSLLQLNNPKCLSSTEHKMHCTVCIPFGRTQSVLSGSSASLV